MNQVVKVSDKTFELFISESEILMEVNSLAKSLSEHYANKELVFVALLNGSFMFASDLMKQMTIPVEISFVKVSSYSGELSSSGEVSTLIGLSNDLSGKEVLIIEDIVDTGLTIDKVLPQLQKSNPSSIAVCTLLFKPDAFKGKEKPAYVGFAIPNEFVVGYGLDYNELGRNLPAIYQLKS